MNKMILRGKRPLTGLKILPVRSQILNDTLKIGDMNLLSFFFFFFFFFIKLTICQMTLPS